MKKRGTRAEGFLVFPSWQDIEPDMWAWVHSQVEKRLPDIREVVRTVERLNRRTKTNNKVWFMLAGDEPPDSWPGGYPFWIFIEVYKKPHVDIVYGLNWQRLACVNLDFKSSWDKLKVIIEIAEALEKKSGVANIEEVLRRAEDKGVDSSDGRRMIADLLRNGYFYSPDNESLKKTK